MRKFCLLYHNNKNYGYLIGMYSLDYETTKLHVVSLRPRHKQADFTSNDAQVWSLCARVDPNVSTVTSAEIFRGHARGFVQRSLVRTPDAASVLVVHRWRKN